VIGGAGYIGSALVPRLLERDFRVRVYDRFLYGEDSLASVTGDPRLEIVDADLGNHGRLASELDRADAVVHLAAIVGDPACDLDARAAIAVNVRGTRLLARAARDHGIRRFVYASTCAVYGVASGDRDERSTPRPVSLYARTKRAGERVVLAAAAPGFAPTILRFASLYGLSGRKRFDLVVNLLAARGWSEGRLTVHGSGEAWRPFAHVEDAARAVVAVLEAPTDRVAGEIFNVGFDDANYTIREVAERVAARIPGTRVIEEPAPAVAASYRVRFGKLRERLGLVAEWDLDRGIDQIAKALERGEIPDPSAARHGNLASLRETGVLAKFAGAWRADAPAPRAPGGEGP
jgi:nucleoside-diphosphate-sugar epimerase